jgi:hypothetical protein
MSLVVLLLSILSFVAFHSSPQAHPIKPKKQIIIRGIKALFIVSPLYNYFIDTF